MPTLYIIAGCSGAGKTTASMTLLPETLHCKEFVNADSIAAGLSPSSALAKDEKGIWRGTAQKDGTTVNVAVDFKGNVVSQ